MIGLGHGLDVSIVAEGVETQEQLCFLADEGCDAVQGYFIGKPAPIAQYAALIGRPRHLEGDLPARLAEQRVDSARSSSSGFDIRCPLERNLRA